MNRGWRKWNCTAPFPRWPLTSGCPAAAVQRAGTCPTFTKTIPTHRPPHPPQGGQRERALPPLSEKWPGDLPRLSPRTYACPDLATSSSCPDSGQGDLCWGWGHTAYCPRGLPTDICYLPENRLPRTWAGWPLPPTSHPGPWPGQKAEEPANLVCDQPLALSETVSSSVQCRQHHKSQGCENSLR